MAICDFVLVVSEKGNDTINKSINKVDNKSKLAIIYRFLKNDIKNYLYDEETKEHLLYWENIEYPTIGIIFLMDIIESLDKKEYSYIKICNNSLSEQRGDLSTPFGIRAVIKIDVK